MLYRKEQIFYKEQLNMLKVNVKDTMMLKEKENIHNSANIINKIQCHILHDYL
ncbi:MAG: hypothetical protein K0S41_2907 [Anaerocolumna sp.]|jgi:hypothetical protein|nr:hypothetical protein [Anaerocolumna sp.]